MACCLATGKSEATVIFEANQTNPFKQIYLKWPLQNGNHFLQNFSVLTYTDQNTMGDYLYTTFKRVWLSIYFVSKLSLVTFVRNSSIANMWVLVRVIAGHSRRQACTCDRASMCLWSSQKKDSCVSRTFKRFSRKIYEIFAKNTPRFRLTEPFVQW